MTDSPDAASEGSVDARPHHQSGSADRPAPPDLRPHFWAASELFEQFPDGLDWADWLAGDSLPADTPVELDIGCGRGWFLVNESQSHPARRFVGLELDFTEGRRTARRLQRNRLHNARVIGGDAREVLRRLVPPASVDVAHVLFPDPWWKRRHRRRRIFTDTFLDQIVGILSPGGTLHAATDVGDYWEVIAALVDHHPRFERRPEVEATVPDAPEHRYLTSFERKKRAEGETIDRGFWRLID